MISSLAVGFLAFLSFHVILYILIFYVLSVFCCCEDYIRPTPIVCTIFVQFLLENALVSPQNPMVCTILIQSLHKKCFQLQYFARNALKEYLLNYCVMFYKFHFQFLHCFCCTKSVFNTHLVSYQLFFFNKSRTKFWYIAKYISYQNIDMVTCLYQNSSFLLRISKFFISSINVEYIYFNLNIFLVIFV